MVEVSRRAFCSRYFSGVETQENRAARNEDNESSQVDASLTFGPFGREIGISVIQCLDPIELMRAYRYVLFNCDAMKEFIERYDNIARMTNRRIRTARDLANLRSREFPTWVKNHVERTRAAGRVVADEVN